MVENVLAVHVDGFIVLSQAKLHPCRGERVLGRFCLGDKRGHHEVAAGTHRPPSRSDSLRQIPSNVRSVDGASG